MIIINEKKCIGCGQCAQDCVARNIALRTSVANGCAPIQMGEKMKAEASQTFCIDCGHCVAVCPSAAIQLCGYDAEEIKPFDKESFMVDPQVLLNAIKFRRSVRRFKPERIVEQGKIQMIIDAGRYTPTGVNLQRVSYIVVEKEVERLRELAANALQEMSDEVLSTENLSPMKEEQALLWKDMAESYWADSRKGDRLTFGAPVVIAVVAGDEDGLSKTDAALAASSMETMLNALELGGFFCGFLTMVAQHDHRVKEFLKIEGKQEVVTFLCLGYPDVQYVRTVPRKPARVVWL